MNGTDEIQNIQFSTDNKFINISTSEGFWAVSADPSC